MKKNIIVTGGCGFIGSSLIRKLLKNKNNNILNIDCLTYASSLDSKNEFNKFSNYNLLKINICSNKILNIIKNFKPLCVYHLAAESHVDNSIKKPDEFINTNIYGTFNLLNSCQKYLLKNKLNTKNFRFIHVSTDEVYGSLKMNSPSSKENDVYNPSSPYSASKASADHLVNSWHLTYNFPSITTHCSNNYGPFQNKEKLIPLTITRLLNKKNIPIYGDGSNIRDWIHVDDHVDALILIQKKGILGNTYNIGSNTEISNLTLVLKICRILDKLFPFNKMHKQYITYVKDRLGHDLRYSINTLKINKKLNFKPKIKIEDGLKKTIKWYVEKFKI